jgi:hypothetical protein
MKAIVYEISHEFLKFLMNLLAFVPIDGYILAFVLEIIFAGIDKNLDQHAEIMKGMQGEFWPAGLELMNTSSRPDPDQ